MPELLSEAMASALHHKQMAAIKKYLRLAM
jgi:hypothetical protein